MGLFDFLQNLFKTPIPSRFEDIFNYDYPELLKKSTFIGKLDNLNSVFGVSDEINPEKRIHFVYECIINPPFLNSFDTLKMYLRSEVKEIEVDGFITITFLSKRKNLTNKQIDYVVDSVLEACKYDESIDWNNRAAIEFKAGKINYMSLELNEDTTVSIRNDVNLGIYIHTAIIYADLQRLAQE